MAKAKYTMGADGFYRAKVWDGTYNADGSKHRIGLSSKKSSGDLEKKVNALKAKVQNGQIVQITHISFLEYARTWKNTYKSIREDNTQTMYENIIEKHLYVLEGIDLQNIRKIHFQTVITNAAQSPRTCQQIALTFKQIIKSAIQDKLLPANAYNDICANIDLPKYIPEEKRALFPEEVTAMKKADLTPMQRCFLYIIYGCGLRRSEVLALNKDLHIDFKKNVLRVNNAVIFNGNDPKIKGPKSHNGYREVPMPDFLVQYLKEYIPTLTSPYLMHRKDGSLMSKSSYDKMWAQITQKMNTTAGGTKNIKVIYGFTAHTFRHNYCSTLCYQVPAISIKKIAQLMGDTEEVVLKVYNHVMEERENVEKVINEVIAL